MEPMEPHQEPPLLHLPIFLEGKESITEVDGTLVRKSCTVNDGVELEGVGVWLLNGLLDRKFTTHVGFQWNLLVWAGLRLKPRKLRPSDATNTE